MGECFFWYRPTRVVPDQRPLTVVVVVVVRNHYIGAYSIQYCKESFSSFIVDVYPIFSVRSHNLGRILDLGITKYSIPNFGIGKSG